MRFGLRNLYLNEASETGDGGGAPAGDTPPEQGKTEPEALSGNDLFKKGNSHAEKVHAEWLKKTFGTADRAEIEKKIAGKVAPKETELPANVTQKMTEMANEIETLRGQLSARDRNQALADGILSSGLEFNDRKDVIDLMQLRYEFKPHEGRMIAYDKQTGEPVIIGNKFAEVKDVLNAWSKDPQKSYLFAKGQKTGMPDAVKTASNRLKTGELTNPAFVQALKDSGEYMKAMTDQPFDRDKVEHFLKMQNGGKNLTAVHVG